jgi:hypothetical protein
LAERQLDELDDNDELVDDDLDDDEISDDELGDDDLDVDDEEVVAVLETEDPDELDSAEGDEEDEAEDASDEDEDEEPGATVGSGQDDDSDETSLDELLAKRSAKRASDAPEEDIMSLVGQERDEPVVEPLPTRAQPIRDRQEFVCSRCRLVKPRVQLADAERGLCRDCV